MATCNVVNVLCPNGRRQKVKVSPLMTLLQLVQEVCKKQSLNPNNCSIRHQRKVLDSSLTVRFANLPNNAHLELIESAEELVRTVKKCVVALQLENGDRLVHEFSSNESLLGILEHWKTQSGRITFSENAEEIACIYASQQIRGLQKLKSTTLSMIGLNGGRGVIRLIQSSANPGKVESEMMEGVCEKAIPPVTKAEITVSSPVPAKISTEEMDIASRSASSVSMASQGSEDFTMQCAETVAGPVIESEKPSVNEPNVDTKPCKSKSGEKTQEMSSAMDVEQSEHRVDLRKEASDKDQPDKNQSDKDQSDVPTKKGTSAATVQVFGGVGRTLNDGGPEIKKARYNSPPPDDMLKSISHFQEGSKNLVEEHKSVGQIDRETVTFRLGEGSSISSDDITDDFFEVTVDDLRLMLKDLKNERTAEAPLLTKDMRERREKSKVEQYEKVAIRVYFPDRSVLQGFFSPTETVSAVSYFVKENLQQKDVNFYLYTTPPRTLLDKPDRTLFEAKLFPTAIIHFGTRETQDSYLSSSVIDKMMNIAEANEKVGRHYSRSSTSLPQDTLADNCTETGAADKDDEKSIAVESASTSGAVASDTRSNVPRNPNKAVPKWFKLEILVNNTRIGTGNSASNYRIIALFLHFFLVYLTAYAALILFFGSLK